MKKRSIHISYKDQHHDNRYDKYMEIILRCLEEDKIERSHYKILDVACGRGELLRKLKMNEFAVEGFDSDEECCRLSSKYGPCIRGDIHEINDYFEENFADVVVMSHVVEHLKDPVAQIKKVQAISKKWLIISVPNPIRPKVLVNALRRRLYSNKGHYYCWDYSHFINFITRYSGLELVKLEGDEVKIPGKYIRKFFNFLFLLDFLELKLLPKLFPNFTTSLIALVKK